MLRNPKVKSEDDNDDSDDDSSHHNSHQNKRIHKATDNKRCDELGARLIYFLKA